MSRYRFERWHPEAVGFGPALQVSDGETGAVFGFVRRIEPSSPTARVSWMVYDREGGEVGIAPTRVAAADFLRAAAEKDAP